MSDADLIGTPFKYGARPNSKGEFEYLDCYGVVVEVSRRRGVCLPIRQFAERREIVAQLMNLQMSEWRRTEKKEGAVVLFKIGGVLCHVGIVTGFDTFLHTWEKSGGVCQERLSDWERRIEGFYEYQG